MSRQSVEEYRANEARRARSAAAHVAQIIKILRETVAAQDAEIKRLKIDLAKRSRRRPP